MNRFTRFLYTLVLSALFVVAGLSIAQEVPGVGELINLPWNRAFGEVAVFAAIINVLVLFAGRFVDFVQGVGKYLVALGIGVVGGAIGDFANILTAAQYADMPTPLGGISFGLVAALSAVGLHQGKRQTEQQFRDSASRKTRQ